MISKEMENIGKNSSAIREIFEYGNKRKKEIGVQNVFDFSLGNPSIPAPQKLNDTILSLLNDRSSVELHGYTSAAGDANVREKIAGNITKRFGTVANKEDIYITCGAAASLTITLNAICNPGDEIIVLAPFFPEYKIFAKKSGAEVVEVPCRQQDFQIDFSSLEKAITKKTKGIIVNSPNNPTGVVFSEETIKKLSDLLNEKQKEFSTTIFIIADEPYRELVYGGVNVPYIPNYYDNTIVCYSYSKSLSLPGERIGYIFVPKTVAKNTSVYDAVCGAGRCLGYVCAPSLLQQVVGICVDETSDISQYEKNRDLLYNSLVDMGYSAIKPEGAFYLFLKSLEPDAKAFCQRAKKHELLLVPSDSFGCNGYVRIAYCVDYNVIEKSLSAFQKLINDYRSENNE